MREEFAVGRAAGVSFWEWVKATATGLKADNAQSTRKFSRLFPQKNTREGHELKRYQKRAFLSAYSQILPFYSNVLNPFFNE